MALEPQLLLLLCYFLMSYADVRTCSPTWCPYSRVYLRTKRRLQRVQKLPCRRSSFVIGGISCLRFLISASSSYGLSFFCVFNVSAKSVFTLTSRRVCKNTSQENYVLGLPCEGGLITGLHLSGDPRKYVAEVAMCCAYVSPRVLVLP